MTDEELLEVTAYTHQNEIYGRSAAIRKLVQIGLLTEEAAGRFKREP